MHVCASRCVGLNEWVGMWARICASRHAGLNEQAGAHVGASGHVGLDE